MTKSISSRQTVPQARTIPIKKRNSRRKKSLQTRTQLSSVGLINLGCTRNLVDSQIILGNFVKKGYQISDVNKADIVIVNTCSFVEAARKETIDTILELIELKKKKKIKKLVVAGCFPQRYGDQLTDEFKEVDVFMGTQLLEQEKVPDSVLLTPTHYAYVKICESCYNHCSFCAIPGIKGKFRSRTIKSIIKEVKKLDAAGTREINIIGQDITAYGIDLYKRKSLSLLLKEIIKVTKNVRWIRLLYTFPAHITDELIQLIASEEKVCKYIDVPLQHISDNLLKGMNRKFGEGQTRGLIKKIRKKIPSGAIRSTFIVGLPGETKENFQELTRFVKDACFERMGVFPYSREEGTKAYNMPMQVPEATKKRRFNKLMTIQQQVSKKVQESFVGRELTVLIDEPQKNDKTMYIGRTEYDAPEVDGLVYVYSKKKLCPGDFVNVKIKDSYEYDLVGEAI